MVYPRIQIRTDFEKNICKMKTAILSFCLFALFSGTGFAQKIYSVDSPVRSDVKVFVVDREYRADIVVYRTDKDYRAKASENKGIWFFCDREYQADKKVFFVDREYQADIKVFFTDKEYRAGWKNNRKKHLLY